MELPSIWMLLAISPVWGCPETWYSEGPHCYMYMSNPTDWPTARENCIAEGGHLVSIGGDQEESFLTSFRDSEGVVGNPVWLGMKGDTNQTWTWDDNTPLLWSSINFLDPPLTDNCLSLSGQVGMHSWESIPCVMPLDSICEFDAAEDTEKSSCIKCIRARPGIGQLRYVELLLLVKSLAPEEVVKLITKCGGVYINDHF